MGFWSGLISWLNWLMTPSTKLNLIASMQDGPVRTAIVIGKLVRKNNMTAIANANVNVTVTPPSGAATTVAKVTDSTGKFSISVPLVLVGSYAVKADYLGVANQYKSSSALVMITALAAAVPTTLVIMPSATSGTVGDTITISVVLET